MCLFQGKNGRVFGSVSHLVMSTNERGELSLLVSKFLRDLLQSLEHPLTQEPKGGSTVAHSLNKLELVHFSFDDPIPPGSGKGNDVAIIPSPKNRTGEFPHIRLKPLVPPV
jgi:hypothetical protein